MSTALLIPQAPQVDLSPYALKSDLSGYLTRDQIIELIKSTPVPGSTATIQLQITPNFFNMVTIVGTRVSRTFTYTAFGDVYRYFADDTVSTTSFTIESIFDYPVSTASVEGATLTSAYKKITPTSSITLSASPSHSVTCQDTNFTTHVSTLSFEYYAAVIDSKVCLRCTPSFGYGVVKIDRNYIPTANVVVSGTIKDYTLPTADKSKVIATITFVITYA